MRAGVYLCVQDEERGGGRKRDREIERESQSCCARTRDRERKHRNVETNVESASRETHRAARHACTHMRTPPNPSPFFHAFHIPTCVSVAIGKLSDDTYESHLAGARSCTHCVAARVGARKSSTTTAITARIFLPSHRSCRAEGYRACN